MVMESKAYIFSLGALIVIMLYFLSNHYKAEGETLQQQQTLQNNQERQQVLPDTSVKQNSKLNFDDLFPFKLGTIYNHCENLPKPEHTDEYKDKLQQFNSQIKKTLANKPFEGNTGDSKAQAQFEFYCVLAQQPWIKTVCEIGFNLGHSAFQFLSCSKDLHMYSYDLNSHFYTTPMADYMKQTFHGRFDFFPGDSLKTVKPLPQKCNLLIVDGGHDYKHAYQDMINMKALANQTHHLVLLDDCPTNFNAPDVYRAWIDLSLEQHIVHIFACYHKNSRKRAIAFNQYNFD